MNDDELRSLEKTTSKTRSLIAASKKLIEYLNNVLKPTPETGVEKTTERFENDQSDRSSIK